jgi:hypothetical protein
VNSVARANGCAIGSTPVSDTKPVRFTLNQTPLEHARRAAGHHGRPGPGRAAASGPGGSHNCPARCPCHPRRQARPPPVGQARRGLADAAGQPVSSAGRGLRLLPHRRPGRVADRATITTLGWRGGDRLNLTADARVMIARRDSGGMVTVPARPYIVIPAALCRLCGLRAGCRQWCTSSRGGPMSCDHYRLRPC